MYTRRSGVVLFSLVVLWAAGCGGDDSSSTSAAASASCTPGIQSAPGTPGDPCPQNDAVCPWNPTPTVPACAATGCEAFTLCTAQSTWDTMCQCRPRPGAGAGLGGQGGAGGGVPPVPMGGTGAPPAAVCGNGVVEMGEACEANVALAETCMSLGMGSGMLSCDPMTCMYDMSMCAPPMMGTGGTGGT